MKGKRRTYLQKNVTFIKIAAHAIHDLCRLFSILENDGISHKGSKS